MVHHRIGLILVLLLGGCSTIKDVSPYGEPFTIDHDYVTSGPVSAYIGDTPFESASGMRVPDQHAVRDPDVLLPGTRVRFTRKDAPYLVFLVLTGSERGRYAWVQQHSEDIKSFQPVTSEVSNP
jgi:hypothetical protein